MAESTSPGKGHVKERMIRQRRYGPVLTAAAEASNAIAVGIQMRTYEASDNEYVDATESMTLECHLVDDNGTDALVAAFTMAETGNGAEISATGQPRLIISTDASGTATVTVTDVSGAFAGSVHLLVNVLNKPGFHAHLELTFA